MRIIYSIFIAIIAICVLSAADVSAQANKPESTAAAAAERQIFEELAERDRVLFDAVFKTCDLAKLAELVTEDFEFYHDRAGNNAKSGKEFVKSIGEGCEKRKSGADVRVRREVVENSLQIYPLNNYGAIQMGVHRFYILGEGGRENLAEVAKFTHLWKKESGVWKLARVLSYDHKPAAR